MKALLKMGVFVVAFFATTVAWGQSVSTKAAISSPNFKATFDSLYYDFQGRHDSDSGLYGFEGVSYSTQTMQLTYLATPTLNFAVQARQIRNYAETKFGPIFSKDVSQGMGDTKLKATKTFISGFDLIIADLTLSVPTGSISEKNVNAPDYNYPYNMQLGSGTYDLEPSLIYLATRRRHQMGGLAMAILRTGRNQYDYRRGNEYISRVWYSYLADPLLMPGLWLNYRHVQRMNGQDSTYGRLPVMAFYHSPRNFWEFAANINSQYEITKNLKLKALVGRPLWQESNNIENLQVYTRWFAQVGAEGTF